MKRILLLLGFTAAASTPCLHAQITPPGQSREAWLTKAIGQRVPAGQTRTVTGEVISQTGRKPEIALRDGGFLPVANAESVTRLPLGVAFEFEVTAAPGGSAVNVSKADLSAAADWRKARPLLAQSDFSDLHAAFSKLNTTVASLTTTGAMGADDPKFLEQIEELYQKLIKAYQKPEAADAKSRQAIVECFAEVRDIRRKAIYGRVNNYWPEVYQRIHDNSRSSVGIARKGSYTPLGSGVLIGDSLVLTCRHVAAEFTKKSDIRVWFDYETTSAAPLTKREFEVAQVLSGPAPAAGAPQLDFVLLLLKPGADGKLAHEAYKPVVLSLSEPALDEAIYVIGHPAKQPKMVHDNAYVLFPYQVNQDQMAELRLNVATEVATDQKKEQILAQFLQSYRELPDKSGFQQYSLRWYNSPVIAADCDTFHGNSGSGAWDRITNKLVGVLFAGESDKAGLAYSPGWRRHEAILPISVISQDISQWKAEQWKDTPWKADWLADFNVKME